MQRKATRQSRGANAKEKAFMGWVKQQPCSFCEDATLCDVDHCKGSSFKQNKILIGHVFINSKCQVCHYTASTGFRPHLFDLFGKTDSDATLEQMEQYEAETGETFSEEVKQAIRDVYAVGEDTTSEWEGKL